MNYFTKSNALSAACFAALISFTSACSPAGNLALKSVDLSTSLVGTETYVNMTANLGMGSLQFPSIDIPIINPKTMASLGELSLATQLDGTSQLAISIDYEAATKLDPSGGNILPNGRELPLGLGITSSTNMIAIPILKNSKIYIGGDFQSNFYIGTAIAISAFDTALSQVQLPLNIFFGVPFSTQVLGEAGVFTGPAAGQNGIGVFVRKSTTASTTTLTSTAVSKAQSRSVASVETNVSVTTAPTTARTGGEEMYKLNTTSLLKLNNLFKTRGTVKIK